MAKFDNHGYITELEDNEVFVFGSNGQGAHLGGAAAIAVQKFGAKMGQAEGLQGQSYAINTMDSEDEMHQQIGRFLRFACNHLHDYKFYVTEIGCGIAGYSPNQIAPYFAYHWQNVVLPESFEKAIDKYMDRIISNTDNLLYFEYGMGGAMGGNQGGVWFWYLDENGELKSWHSLATEKFFQFGKKASEPFAEFSGGMGNYLYINKNAKYLGREIGEGWNSGFMTFEFNNKKCRVKCSCTGVVGEASYHLKEGLKIADCDCSKRFIIG